jgi:DNA-binding LytR/AlgR family response regulator
MHYTAMAGMHVVPLSAEVHPHVGGLAASQQLLSIIVAVLCFVIAAGFLLSLVPEPRRQVAATPAEPAALAAVQVAEAAIPSQEPDPAPIAVASPRLMPAPLGGLGQPPRAAPAQRLPVEAADGTHFIDVADIRSVRADAHYTRVHDGTRERMCPWSISEAEAQLDPALFVRVHRSHIVALPHVTFVRKEGDGAIIELGGPSPHRVPVSRAKIAEVKARLGLARRHA